MRTDALAAVLRQLRDHIARITDRADAQARDAGLTVEQLPRGRRRYRDPRMNSHAGSAANPDITPPADVRKLISTPWSTPTLTVSAPLAGTGWSR